MTDWIELARVGAARVSWDPDADHFYVEELDPNGGVLNAVPMDGQQAGTLLSSSLFTYTDAHERRRGYHDR